MSGSSSTTRARRMFLRQGYQRRRDASSAGGRPHLRGGSGGRAWRIKPPPKRRAGANQEDPMRIVVTGGTGFIGREVVSRLLETPGDEVAVTTREPGRPDPWGGRVEKVQAFAGDALSLGKAFTGADVVIHAIQFPNHPVEDPSRGRTYL